MSDEQPYGVVVNDEEQYSVWPVGRAIPLGWDAAGFEGARDECLSYIGEVWTDIRPASLRRSLETAAVI
jgi:MbtH protein